MCNKKHFISSLCSPKMSPSIEGKSKLPNSFKQSQLNQVIPPKRTKISPSCYSNVLSFPLTCVPLPLLLLLLAGCGQVTPTEGAKEIFQVLLAHNNQIQASEFVDLVYQFKRNYSSNYKSYAPTSSSSSSPGGVNSGPLLDFRPVADKLQNSIYDSMVRTEPLVESV